jgi:mono/diheme cytochrome c family protein
MNRMLTGFILAAAVVSAAGPAKADGAAVFEKKCATCHGKDGKGATAMGKKLQIKDLATPEIQAKSDAELEGKVAAGNAEKKMPSFKDKLTADEIKAAVQHVRTFKK